ncbi:MAG: trypsin-like peptidase domain-containing protein [Pirellulales bacterium]|nr:trypsin-like peptidase domain-containing protein [Pirellulales bacterium]
MDVHRFVNRATLFWIFTSVLWLGFFNRPLEAQLQIDEVASRVERDRLYENLARDVTELEQRFGIVKRVVQLVQPTVVHVEAARSQESNLRYGSQADIEEAGSGVIVDIQGKPYVLTNRHVIKFAEPSGVKIRLMDGRLIHPTKIWEDRETDVAVMAVDAKNLVESRLGDSNLLEIGDFVLAVGSPFGLSRSVTYGIVSAKGRHDLDLGDGEVRYQNFLQTDAAINPGNSGGPLINLRGEVVGINTAIASNSGGNDGIGFSIPINIVMHIARQLTEKGKVARAFLGVRLDSSYATNDDGKDGLIRPQGARVTDVTPGSPAESSGIHIGDVVLSFDGIRIMNDSQLVNVVGLTEVNREIEIRLARDGKIIRKVIQVVDKADFPASGRR